VAAAGRVHVRPAAVLHLQEQRLIIRNASFAENRGSGDADDGVRRRFTVGADGTRRPTATTGGNRRSLASERVTLFRTLSPADCCSESGERNDIIRPQSHLVIE